MTRSPLPSFEDDGLTLSHGGVRMARKFFYVCAGMFLLALSYHLGASTATAQGSGNPIVAAFGQAPVVVTANGDVYVSNGGNGGTWTGWVRVTNVFSGAPVPAQHESWGQVKARYRGAPGVPVTPGADNR